MVLALPLLDSLAPRAAKAAAAQTPQRMLLISNNLGILPGQFFPGTTGRDFELSPYLTELAPFRNEITIVNGL